MYLCNVDDIILVRILIFLIFTSKVLHTNTRFVNFNYVSDLYQQQN